LAYHSLERISLYVDSNEPRKPVDETRLDQYKTDHRALLFVVSFVNFLRLFFRKHIQDASHASVLHHIAVCLVGSVVATITPLVPTQAHTDFLVLPILAIFGATTRVLFKQCNGELLFP